MNVNVNEEGQCSSVGWIRLDWIEAGAGGLE